MSTRSLSIETRLVDHVLRSAAREPTAAALDAARRFILDSLGVALSGTRVPMVATLELVAERWGTGQDARLWGSGKRVPASTAAFINGYQIHNQEFDCLHEGAVVHPMAVVLSTLLAWSEQHGSISGRDLLRATCIAVDVAATIGISANNPLRFFRPAMAGAFGATAGLGALARMNEETLHDALGLVYSQLSGTMQAHVEGSPVLPMQIGFNARAVLAACELATHGVPGPRAFLSGPFGYYRLFDPDWSEERFREALDGGEHITQLSHKPFPSGRATHGAVDGILELQRRHGFSAEQVQEIRVRAPPLVVQLVDRPAAPDMSPSYARLCLPYVAATALLSGSVDVGDFDAAPLLDAQRLDLARRIRVERDDNRSLNALSPQHVEVTLRTGRSVGLELPAVLGSPQRPLTDAQCDDKLRRCCASARTPLPQSQVDALAACVRSLDTLNDVGALIDLLTLRDA